jgi:DNA-binding XRE family transcriptional regulator
MSNLTPSEWLRSTDEEILVDTPITHPDPTFPHLLNEAQERIAAEHRIASSLKELRQSVGMTQVEMGRRWGRTQSFISKIERDPASAEMRSLINYVRALNGRLMVTILVDDHEFTEELVGAEDQPRVEMSE